MHRIAIVCCCLGVASAAYTPAPPGGRPLCAVRGATFCERVDQYPTKIIKSLLQSKSLSLEDFFTDESQGLDEPQDYLLHEDLMSPQGDVKARKVRSIRNFLKMDTEDLSKQCPILSKAAVPKMAANDVGEWRFIVQDEQATQKIQVYMCDTSEVCKKHCLQFYAPMPMVSIDQSGTVSKDNFWMPSSCRCQDTPINDK